MKYNYKQAVTNKLIEFINESLANGTLNLADFETERDLIEELNIIFEPTICIDDNTAANYLAGNLNLLYESLCAYNEYTFCEHISGRTPNSYLVLEQSSSDTAIRLHVAVKCINEVAPRLLKGETLTIVEPDSIDTILDQYDYKAAVTAELNAYLDTIDCSDEDEYESIIYDADEFLENKWRLEWYSKDVTYKLNLERRVLQNPELLKAVIDNVKYKGVELDNFMKYDLDIKLRVMHDVALDELRKRGTA